MSTNAGAKRDPVMPDADRALALLDNSDLICGEAEVDAALETLAREIGAALKDDYPLVVAVMGGAVVFAGKLLPMLRQLQRLRLHPAPRLLHQIPLIV